MTAIVKKSDKINFGALRKYNNQYYHKLNNIYIDTIAVAEYLGIAAGTRDDSLVKKIPQNIEVPSHNGNASVKRTPIQIKKIFSDSANSGQWEKSLTFSISLTEDLVASYIKLLLRSKPLMILTSFKGNESEINVSLAEVINNGSGRVIEDRIQARAIGAIYASPKEYAAYLGALLKFKLPDDVIMQYIEMKARRDLIIHAGGVVNDIYVSKVSAFGQQATVGNRISVDRNYFEESMRGMKRFAAVILEQALKQYGNDSDVHRVISERGI